MINNTLKNVQKCFQFLYCTQTNVRIEQVVQVVYPNCNHNDTGETLNKGNGTSPTVKKVTTLFYDGVV